MNQQNHDYYHQNGQKKQQQAQAQPRAVFPLAIGGVIMKANSHGDDENHSATATDDDQNDDKCMSDRLNQLSIEERTKGIHELHGVADDQEIIESSMTREILRAKLQEMTRIAATSFDIQATVAYRMALGNTSPPDSNPYVDRIKLLCLRADYYDVHKAAARLVSFFAYKQQLLGANNNHATNNLLGREITMDDFDENDKKGMDNGVFQLLQQRDRAGRGIIMLVTKKLAECNVETCFRCFYYVAMQALRDEEIQKRGIVVVVFCLGQKMFFSDRPAKFAQSLWLLPIRLVACHFCYDNPLMGVAAKIMSTTLESQHLCRFRSHLGSYIECVYHLMTFGIPKDVIPMELENGELDLEPHQSWLAMVQAREQQKQLQQQSLQVEQQACDSSNNKGSAKSISFPTVVASGTIDDMASVVSNNGISFPATILSSSGGGGITDTGGSIEIAVPGPMDIIVGRGNLSRSSAGYLRMRHLVQEHRPDYEVANKAQKTKISKLILEKAQAAGCRFVRWTPQGYYQCDEGQARDKISHAFRNMRRIPPNKTISTTSDASKRGKGGKGSKRAYPLVVELR